MNERKFNITLDIYDSHSKVFNEDVCNNPRIQFVTNSCEIWEIAENGDKLNTNMSASS
jgi:hypothetical protein